jgi:hypothetical protein
MAQRLQPAEGHPCLEKWSFINCEIVVRWHVPPIGEESLFTSKFVSQISLLVKCSHPCLLKFFGWLFPTESSPGQIRIEYARNGNLRDFLFDSMRLTIQKLQSLFVGLCKK